MLFVHTYLLSALVFAKYKTKWHKGEKRQGKYRYPGKYDDRKYQLHLGNIAFKIATIFTWGVNQ